MTRLNDDDMQAIINQYKRNELFFTKNYNCSLLEIGNYAMNKNYTYAELKKLKVACVPVTSGLGEISNFSKIVCSIVSDCCGVNGFVTENKNLAGIQEAYERNADIIFMADDDTFSAFNLKAHLYADNGEATGRGFAAALELTAGCLVNKEVLVLGAGPVGCAGATYLSQRNAIVKIYDQCTDKVIDYVKKHPKVEMLKTWKNRTWDYILEATNGANIIGESQITNQTICSAPGVPLGIEEDAVNKCKLVIHNMLELGVVTMLSGVGKEASHGKANYTLRKKESAVI